MRQHGREGVIADEIDGSVKPHGGEPAENPNDKGKREEEARLRAQPLAQATSETSAGSSLEPSSRQLRLLAPGLRREAALTQSDGHRAADGSHHFSSTHLLARRQPADLNRRRERELDEGAGRELGRAEQHTRIAEVHHGARAPIGVSRTPILDRYGESNALRPLNNCHGHLAEHL